LCVTFSALPTIANTNWQWDFGDAQTSIGQGPVNCFKDEGIYTVSLTAISDQGCSNTIQKTDLITVYKIPKALFTAEPKETTLSNPLISVVNQSVGAEEFLWNFGDSITSTQIQPSHSYTESGNYCIWLIAKNDFGCIDSTKDCVIIKPNYTLFIPNGFTPNGDGLNDVFEIQGNYFQSCNLEIYDRWGKSFFNKAGTLGVSWDGGNAPQGVYVYKIKMRDTQNKDYEYIGELTVLR
jgi:gliding motility-associated-like protein